MLIDRITKLNDTLYKAFAELKENKEHITNPKHQAGIADKIYELYELEYKLIRGELKAEDESVIELEIEKTARAEELKRRKAILTPVCRRRRFLFWKWYTNRAEDLYEKESIIKAETFLNTKETALEQLVEIIRAADEAAPSEAFEEPQSQEELRKELRRQEREKRKEEKRAAKAARAEQRAAGKAAKKDKCNADNTPPGNEITPE